MNHPLAANCRCLDCPGAGCTCGCQACTCAPRCSCEAAGQGCGPYANA